MKKYGSFDETATPGSPPPGMYVPLIFPSLLTLDRRTRDGRNVEGSTFAPFDLPVSIQAKLTDGPGHDAAFIAGRLDEVVVGDDGNVTGRGWALDSPDGRKVAHLVKTKAMRGNSVDLSVKPEDVDVEVHETDGKWVMHADFRNARLAATTLLPKPAFQDAGASVEVPDDWSVEGVDDAEAITAAASAEPVLVAFNIVKDRPSAKAENFSNPNLTGPTPNFIDTDGRVFGHLATWGTEHISADGVVPPRGSDYRFFANKHILTDDGYIPVGVLVAGGDHADKRLGWREAIDAYANTCAAWASVAIGEDGHGIWYSGQVHKGLSADEVNERRASVPSGDWRRIGVDLELVAALSVNAGGFPIPRAASFGHESDFPMTLTGAGLVVPKSAAAQPFTIDSHFESSVAYLAGLFAAEEARKVAEGLRDLDL